MWFSFILTRCKCAAFIYFASSQLSNVYVYMHGISGSAIFILTQMNRKNCAKIDSQNKNKNFWGYVGEKMIFPEWSEQVWAREKQLFLLFFPDRNSWKMQKSHFLSELIKWSEVECGGYLLVTTTWSVMFHISHVPRNKF